ncbi:hypothetical protein GOV07_01275 [Candidatus Woesearchaeota archaeon]|nr:hypothetical protein [Candidatus Woesearchaeota archaeon]
MTGKKELVTMQKEVAKLSPKETKELLLVTMYKLALVRSQVDALSEIIVKKKLATREELWELTSERFHEEGF